MPSAAASLGQLAVVSDVISRDQHRELTRHLQQSLRQGQPISYARLMVKKGIPRQVVEKLLSKGADLEAVRCDACGASIPQRTLLKRREYPCLRCGAPLLGFRAYSGAQATQASPAARAPTATPPGLPASRPQPQPQPAPQPQPVSPQPDGPVKAKLDLELPTITHGQVLPLPGEDGRRRDLELPTPTGRHAPPAEPVPAARPGPRPTELPDAAEGGTLLFRDVLRAPKPDDIPAHLSQDLSTLNFHDVFKLPGSASDVMLSDEDLVTEYGALTSEQGQIVIEDSVAPEEYAEIGGFKVLAALGEGGMGRVYLAREAETGRDVALKVLRGTLATDGEFLERFQQEAQAITGHRHENVVEIMAAGHDAHYDMHYIAFEYVSGGTLEDKIGDGPLTEVRSLEIALGIARGLSFTAGLGLVHRDVKPSNIILTETGAPKLADLGLARQLDRTTRVTAAGVVLGTPAYIAPEQATDVDDLDVRADLYALGVCLYEMLSAKLPLEDDVETVEILLRHVEEDVPDVRLVAPQTSPATAQLVKGLCERKRKRRYPTPEAAIFDIERVLAGKQPVGPQQAAQRCQPPAKAGSFPAAPQPGQSKTPPRAPLPDPKAETVDMSDTAPPQHMRNQPAPAPAPPAEPPASKGSGLGLVLLVLGLLLTLALAGGVVVAWYLGYLRPPA